MNLTFIICISIVLYIVAIGGMWHVLDNLDKTKRIFLIIIQLILTYAITLIIFFISKGSINYPNEMSEVSTRRMLVLILAGVNSLIITPIISKRISKFYDGQMSKEMFIKQVGMILLIFAICLSFENGYMKDVQKGIIEIYQKKLS